MDTDTAPPANPEPSQPPRRRWLRRFFLAAAAGAVLLAGGAILQGPEFHRLRLPVGGPLEGRDPAAAALAASQDARRLVTELSAVHAASGRIGRWETVITEREINAWLATDLPRNHAAIAGSWGRDARVELLPGRVRAGCRLAAGPLSAVGWIEAEVRLRTINQLGVVITDARLGSLPVPRGPILKALGRLLTSVGMVTDIRRFDDHAVLVVNLPPSTDAAARSRFLESLLVTTGELAFTGETRSSTAGTQGPSAQHSVTRHTTEP